MYVANITQSFHMGVRLIVFQHLYSLESQGREYIAIIIHVLVTLPPVQSFITSLSTCIDCYLLFGSCAFSVLSIEMYFHGVNFVILKGKILT